ncbi:MAG TPA: hypothetical protein VGM88_09150 [Kofleriaceae bacterium]
MADRTAQEKLDALARRAAELDKLTEEAMKVPHAAARDAITSKIEAELAQIGEQRRELELDIEEAEVAANLTEFARLTGRSPRITFELTPGNLRTRYDPRTRTIDVGDDFSKRALFRELARAIEHDVPAIAEAARSMRAARIASGHGDLGPDLVPEGMASFVDEEAMLELYRRDPEYFQFMMGVIATLKKR